MSDSGPGRREVAYRLFAAEFDDAEFSYSESDEERAPNYVVTPTGARVNRLFAVGVLTEVDDVNPEMVRGRIVDPTGAFVSYAGQYQPEALAFLERAEPPTFVALSGKARTFEPDDGDQIYTSVRPESISEVDAETRDRWVVTTAERTIDRIGVMASAIEAELSGDQLRAALIEEGIDERLADGVALALDYYDTTPAYLDALRETALDAARVVAGEREEVRRLDVAPSEGMGDASDLATVDLSGAPSPSTAAAAAGVDEEGAVEATSEPEAETEPVEESAEPDTDESAEAEASEPADETAEPDVSETTTEAESAPEAEPESAEESEPEPEPEPSEATAESEPSESVEEPDEFEADEEVREEVEEELEDFDPGEFDLDEETREQVEEEYGTEFSTADEVEEADIETPETETDVEEGDTEPDEIESEAEATADEEISEPSSEGAEEPAEPEPVDAETEEEAEADEGPAEETEPAGEVDLEDAVMETMEELDEGDGADRDELVDALVESHGVAAEEVEEAIQDALMSGRCYEPSDGTLKSI